MSEGASITIEKDLAPGDIAQLVGALLSSIERGEIEATPREVDFLRSVAQILPTSNTAA